MKLNKFIILNVMLFLCFACSLTSCSDDNDCSLSSDDCQKEGKILDSISCMCILQNTCTKTCDATKETLNEKTCECIKI